ncbi:MAG: hypothetical protein JWO44_248 [Bacteroidetes bacterium]|jgi:hypothetical protein|nr:hypothetical protein [Bacteroidota bacterium]
MKKEILSTCFFIAFSFAAFSQTTVSTGRTAVAEPVKEEKAQAPATPEKAVSASKEAKTEEPAASSGTAPANGAGSNPATTEKRQPAPEK